MFHQFSDPQLAKIADVLEEVKTLRYFVYFAYILNQDFYEDEEYIIRQGWSGNVFFIINHGSVSYMHKYVY